MTEEKKEVIEVLLANRLYLYSLLYKCFGREPDSAELELLCSEQTGEGFRLLGGSVLEQVKSEYMQLFVGPDRLVAPPWESVYRGEDAMLFQQSTLEVREIYGRYGMQAESYRRVPDDSLALELAFMTELAQRAMNAFQNGESEELIRNLRGSQEFLQKHLLRWIPKFLERMAGAPSELLYPKLSLILDSFLKKDEESLAEILAECV